MQGFESSQLLKFEIIEVHRPASTQYVDGKPIERPERAARIKASVQPLSGRDLLLVPEAHRFKEQYYVYTLGDIQGRDLVRLPDDGNVALNRLSPLKFNVNYQVQSVEYWASYRKARIMRVDTGPGATP